MSDKLLTEHHLQFRSFKVGCTGSPESTLVRLPHCWEFHVMAYCIPVRCPALCPLEHGQLTMTGTAVGDTAYYSCEPGYQLEGSETRTCQNTSDWTGNHPICVEEGK